MMNPFPVLGLPPSQASVMGPGMPCISLPPPQHPLDVIKDNLFALLVKVIAGDNQALGFSLFALISAHVVPDSHLSAH